jgi:hypothetical protein
MASNLVKHLATLALVAFAAAPLAAQELPSDPSQMSDADLRKALMIDPLATGTISQPLFRGAPGTSSGSPSGFGAAWRDAFVGGGYQQVRGGGQADGSIAGGFGLGNPNDAVALETVISSLSTFRSGLFDRTAVSFKVHHMVTSSASIAIGVENALIAGGGKTDGLASVYGVVSKQVRLTESAGFLSGKAVTMSGGVGNGRFRFQNDQIADKKTVNVFGSIGVQFIDQASAFADWGGQDLSLGLSVVPIKAFPIVITPAIADVTGRNGNSARFTMGFGIGMRF